MLNYLKHKYHAFYVLKVFFTRNNGYTFKLEIPIHLATSEYYQLCLLIINIIPDAESVSSIEEIDIHLYNEME
jgi:hypothetical protein